VRVFVFSIVFFSCGCLNEPNAVGIDLLPTSDYPLVKSDTVYANSDSLAYAFITSEVDSRMFVGNYQSYTAWSFVEFGFTGFDSYKSLPILAVKLRMKANYSFGGSASPLGVQLFATTQNWHSDSLMVDSLLSNPTAYYRNPVIGSTSAIASDTSWFEVPISDTAIVRRSIIQEANGLGDGVLLQPLSINGIKGFVSGNVQSVDERPKIAVTFDSMGVQVTREVSATKSRSLTHISSANLVQNSNLLYLQNGVAYRQYLGFDLSGIPIGSSISKANLEITLDSAASARNSYGSDSLVSYYLSNDNLPASTSLKVSTKKTSSGKHVYNVEVARYVQNWLIPIVTQRRLLLLGFSERTTLDRFAFYGKSWPDKTLRPRIIITYTPPPQHRSATP
jgi:hypothetical protein